MGIKGRRLFVKKQKKRKFNKFFSYKNEDRHNRNFLHKNFAKSNSYNTKFTCSNFSNVNFKKSVMKFCGFNGAIFENTEFKNANLKGSRFIGAKFKNTLFYNTKMEKTNFKDATFENVIFVGTSLKAAQGISKELTGVRFFNSPPAVSIDSNLQQAITDAQKNKYIKNSEVLVLNKKGAINKVNILRLQEVFSTGELLWGFKRAKEIINKDFYTLSYLIALIKKELLLARKLNEAPCL